MNKSEKLKTLRISLGKAFGVDASKLTDAEMSQIFTQLEKRDRDEYLKRLETPNYESIKRLPGLKNKTAMESVSDILKCLTSEFKGNSFFAKDSATEGDRVDPLAGGYIDRVQVEMCPYSNPRGIWANNLSSKMILLFSYGSEEEQENYLYALSLGIELMRFAMDNPNMAALCKQIAGKDFSKEAEKGMERVIRKRNKRKQDKRKSSVEAKRKASAIATMKKLVPTLGQVGASEEVVRRMKVLGVKAGTVRRWYNAELEKDREARKEAEARRLGRSPS